MNLPLQLPFPLLNGCLKNLPIIILIPMYHVWRSLFWVVVGTLRCRSSHPTEGDRMLFVDEWLVQAIAL